MIKSQIKQVEKVELYFSCRDLDVGNSLLSGQNVQLILYKEFTVQGGQSSQGWKEIKRTEVVMENLSPDFTTSITVDFVFERSQKFRIACINYKTPKYCSFAQIGYCDFLLGDLLSDKKNLLFLDLKPEDTTIPQDPNKKIGKVVIRSEKKPLEVKKVQFQIKGTQLTNFGTLTSIQPILAIWKPELTQELKETVVKEGFSDWEQVRLCQWYKVWESPKYNSDSVMFPFVSIESGKLCGGDLRLPVKVIDTL